MAEIRLHNTDAIHFSVFDWVEASSSNTDLITVQSSNLALSHYCPCWVWQHGCKFKTCWCQWWCNTALLQISTPCLKASRKVLSTNGCGRLFHIFILSDWEEGMSVGWSSGVWPDKDYLCFTRLSFVLHRARPYFVPCKDWSDAVKFNLRVLFALCTLSIGICSRTLVNGSKQCRLIPWARWEVAGGP